jgi:hypothetical protein
MVIGSDPPARTRSRIPSGPRIVRSKVRFLDRRRAVAKAGLLL